jgi:hypothetical protein
MVQLTRERFLRTGAITAAAGAAGLAGAKIADASVGDQIEAFIYDAGGQVFNVKATEYGAKGDTKIIVGAGTISSGSLSTLTRSDSGTFVSGDVGKTITVQKAGASSAVLSTTIATFVSATTVTLTTAASGAVSGVDFAYGTDDTVAIVNAIAAADVGQTAGGGIGGSTNGPAGTVLFPPGIYTISGAKNGNAAIDLGGHTVNLIGSGGRCLPDVTAASTVLLCADAKAGVLMDSWSIYKGFCVHGNNIATTPIKSTAGSFSTYVDVWATNSAATGWTIWDSQNNSYYACGSTNNAQDGLYLDGGTGGLDFWHFTESGSARYGIYCDTKQLGTLGSFITNTEDVHFFGGSCSSTSAVTATTKVYLVGAIDWAILGMTINGTNLSGPTVQIQQGLAHWIDLSGCTISASSGQRCIDVEASPGTTAYLFLKTDNVRFLSGANSVYISNVSVYTYSGIGWVYDGTVSGPATGSTKPIDTILLGRTGAWQSVTLNSPWSGTVTYRMRSDGIVELKGSATRASGSGTSTLFALPANYRPNNGSGAALKIQGVTQKTTTITAALLTIAASGGAVQSGVASGTTVYLDGISFPTLT